MADRSPLHFKEHVCGGTHITVQLLPPFSSPLLITSTLSHSYLSLSLVTALAKRPFQAKPSQAKVLTGGGDLREAQVDVPLSVSHPCICPHRWALSETP
jgi:hypothetical protein